jgi:RNA polymerase sigma factor (sigma-70 family)
LKSKHYQYIDDLVARIQSGDDAALTELIGFYRPMLRTAVKYCTNRYPALAPYDEDLWADLYLIVRELVHQYDHQQSFFSWYLSTRLEYALQSHARKTYLDSGAGGKRVREVSLEDMPADWEPCVGEDPVGKMLDAAALSDAMSKLSDEHRAAVNLYFFEDMTQEQAAKALNIKQPAFSKRLARALAILREHMESFHE